MRAFREAFILAVFAVPALAPGQELRSHALKAQEYLHSNRPDLAAREFEGILALDPKNVEAHSNLGVLLIFQGDYTGSAPHLRAALQLRPDQWKTEALLGLCEQRLGAGASAKTHLEQSFPRLNDEKLRVQVGMELAGLYYASNDLEKAAAIVAVIRALRPADPDILYTAHRIYSDLADESKLTLAMTAPGSGRLHQLAANDMAKRGNIDPAIAQYRLAIQADAHLPGVHFQLAEALKLSSSEAGRAEADKEYQAALLDNPKDAKAEIGLGDIALSRRDLKSAQACYSQAIQLQPNDPDANFGLAKTLIQGGQPNLAEPYLLRTAAADPFNAAVHMRLANFYRQSGRPEQAAEQLAEFQRLKTIKETLGDVFRDMNPKSSLEEPLDSNPSP